MSWFCLLQHMLILAYVGGNRMEQTFIYFPLISELGLLNSSPTSAALAPWVARQVVKHGVLSFRPSSDLSVHAWRSSIEWRCDPGSLVGCDNVCKMCCWSNLCYFKIIFTYTLLCTSSHFQGGYFVHHTNNLLLNITFLGIRFLLAPSKSWFWQTWRGGLSRSLLLHLSKKKILFPSLQIN